MINKLTVIIPTYNEEKTIEKVLSRIKEIELVASINKEVIIVNDSSKDNTEKIVHSFIKNNPDLIIQYHSFDVNRGKGAAIRKGIEAASGDYLIIQDADLEYDPTDYNDLLKPILFSDADVVYGSRFIGGKPHRILFFWHTVGNKFLTFLLNMFANLNLTDIETCYKVFRTSIIKSIKLEEERFGFEPEVTSKVAKIKNIKIYEVGISYYGRTYEDGKKIGWKDGFRAIYCILKYNIWSR